MKLEGLFDFFDALYGEDNVPQPVAPESVQTGNDAPGDALPTSAGQSASSSITAQSTLPGEANSGALPAARLDVAGLPSGASRPTSVCVKQPDDAARLQAQIAGCLKMETDPALQLFLKQLASDAHKYSVELVRQELEAYLQAANSDDFLNRLAVLHWQWAQDDVAADSDGGLLTRGNTGERETVLARIQANFDWEPQPVLRCYLAKLARQAVTDPVKAANGMESYLDGRTSPTWVWLAAVFVCGSPEAAFQWRLQEVRRRVTNARLLDYLNRLEQAARRNLPAAAEKLEAVAEVMALLDRRAAA